MDGRIRSRDLATNAVNGRVLAPGSVRLEHLDAETVAALREGLLSSAPGAVQPESLAVPYPQVPTPRIPYTPVFSHTGVDLAVADYPGGFLNEETYDLTIRWVSVTVGTAPVGADLLVVVSSDVDGDLVEVSVPAGETRGRTDARASWSADAALSVRVTQVGSTTPGRDMTVKVRAY